MLTKSEEMLLNELNKNVSSYENYFESESADAPPISTPAKTSLASMKGNPVFSAQFDIILAVKYFTCTSSTFTSIAASSLTAALKTKLPYFLFGWNDFKAGFAKVQGQFTLTGGWSYLRPFIYGAESISDLDLDSNVTNVLQKGDLVLPYYSALPGSGTTTYAFVIIRCNQVAYSTLLNSLVSDRFVINNIRITLDDNSLTGQFSNQIGIYTQSLFGKFDSDTVSPSSYKKPEQYQAGIVDIPLKKGIDKRIIIAQNVEYNCVGQTLSIYVWQVSKFGY